MNSLRRLFPLCPQQIFLAKRSSSNSRDLSDEENKLLYDKLMRKSYNEKNEEASSFIKWLIPHDKFGPPRIMSYDWSMKSIFNWMKRQNIEYNKYTQRYTVDRVKVLGSDLAAAHFFVYRNAAIRFRGQDNFIKWENKREEYNTDLPSTYEPNFFVEAIDASDVILYYQGLENLKNLYKLKWLRLKNNPVLNNWHLDYIGYAVPHLEYLDISDCPKVTAAGIAGLQKLTQLKELVINSNNIEIQMACFALEDVIPGLFVSIQSEDNLNSCNLVIEGNIDVNKS
ncbi:distal membrane-arm assembly complex protein 2 [Sipha flava]|uniref:ATP synthase subunit s-like protein n=1 Tax=Sipha flava TaxID=143950 RepID=A0A2S2PWC5_9HEMI|nr:distal membrane-arm assembly complex protein 2 [Sipha flava]XP_025413466.1 distal membrane-arm assembly complex protein 2 [Sipha flava]XP_025413467.1 distal membrane-arm assembly complex protein 2 [Sipha flava]